MEGMNRELYEEFVDSYEEYTDLFDLVGLRALYKQPDPLRRELIFYLGHTASFTRSKLRMVGVDLEEHPFDSLFERGVSPDSSSDLDSFRKVDLYELVKYRVKVASEVSDLFIKEALCNPDIAYALRMGIEHERLHLQTTYPHICKLDDSDKQHPGGYYLDYYDFNPVGLEFVEVEGGVVRLGSGEFVESSTDFMWDNEQGLNEYEVQPFSVSRYPITNTQVIEFIQAGGYQDDEFWEGVYDFGGHVDRIRDRGMPFNFRSDDDGEYLYKTLTNTINRVPLSWPAMLNRYEANAMARFFGGRPISEPEWLLIHDGVSLPVVRNNYIPRSVMSVGQFQIGNIACWTDQNFGPLCSKSEFKVSDLYPDFSSEWFNRKHGVIKGASFMGRGAMLNHGFRDFMQNMMDYPASTYVVKS